MSAAVEAAGVLGGATCLLVGAVAVLRHRGSLRNLPPTFLLAVAVLLLGGSALGFAAVTPDTGTDTAAARLGGFAVLLAAAAVTGAIARLSPRSGAWTGLSIACATLAALTPVVPGYAPESTGEPLWTTYLALAFTAVLVAFVGGAVAVLRSARSSRGIARSHSRLLAVGLLLFAAALPLGTYAYAVRADAPEVIALSFWLLLLPIAVSMAPPAPVTIALRNRAAGHRRESQVRLFEATTSEEALGLLMPTIMASMGAIAVALLAPDGRRLWSDGLTEDERARLDSRLPPGQALLDRPTPPVVLPLRTGSLVIVPHPLTPHNGAVGRDHLDSVAVELDLALLAAQRLTMLAGERAERARLQSAQEQLDADNAALREYGRAIAHDLKTPLTVIRGAAETIDRLEDLSPAGQDMVRRVIRHSDRVAEMIDDQLQAATGTTHRDDVDLSAVCEWLRATVEDELSESGSTLAWSRDLPVVSANRGLLERVLLNLVRNALQHATGAGAITVFVQMAPDGTSILVTDDGTGMAASDADRIFESGVRLDGAGAGGLGLADSRAALRRIGGDLVVVDTAPGVGTTMAIVLPTAATGRAPTASAAQPRPHQPANP